MHDTSPKAARCRRCHSLVLAAWIEGVHTHVDVMTYAAGAAALSASSGHAVYRVRSDTRKPILTRVVDLDEVTDRHRYVLGHTCPPPASAST